MKNNFLLIFILIAAAITSLFIGCKKSKSSAVIQGNVLNSNASIVDTANVVSVTDSIVTITGSKKYQVGDIILGAPTVANPFGFLRQITGIATNGNNVIYTTQQSDLNTAFKQLNIDTTFSLSSAQSANFRKTDATLTINFNNNTTIAPGIVINGALLINITNVKIHYGKSLGSLLPQSIIISTDINTNGSSIEISNSASISVPDAVTLKTFVLEPFIIRVPIGPILFPIPIGQQIVLNTLPLNITGKSTLTVVPTISATVGCKYANGTWQNLCTYNTNANLAPPIQTNFAASLNANVTVFTPRYEIAPYGSALLKGYFEIPNSLDFTIQTSSPNYKIDYNLDVTGGFQTKFWDGATNDFSINGNVISKTLAQGNWNDSLYIGKSYGGGIIAYILQPTDPGYSAITPHGLIAAPTDQSTGIIFMDTIISSVSEHTDTTMGAGMAYTDSTIAVYGARAYAASLCRNLTLGGYTDWYLPSLFELNKLYLNQTAIGNFNNSATYWSSQFTDPYDVFGIGFSVGSHANLPVSTICYVRAVRSF